MPAIKVWHMRNRPLALAAGCTLRSSSARKATGKLYGPILSFTVAIAVIRPNAVQPAET